MLLHHLAATSTVEYPPQRKIVSKLLVVMFGPRGHNQDIARLERISPTTVDENSPATNNDVDLVLHVRRLPIRGHGHREPYVQSATVQNEDSSFTGGTGDSGLCLSKTDHTATIRWFHGAVSVPPNDELERRTVSQASNEGTLSTTSKFSEPHRNYRPRVRSKALLGGAS
jgi:hypothetical protein